MSGMKAMQALLERWHALWLLTQCWTAAAVAAAFVEGGPKPESTEAMGAGVDARDDG